MLFAFCLFHHNIIFSLLDIDHYSEIQSWFYFLPWGIPQVNLTGNDWVYWFFCISCVFLKIAFWLVLWVLMCECNEKFDEKSPLCRLVDSLVRLRSCAKLTCSHAFPEQARRFRSLRHLVRVNFQIWFSHFCTRFR